MVWTDLGSGGVFALSAGLSSCASVFEQSLETYTCPAPNGNLYKEMHVSEYCCKMNRSLVLKPQISVAGVGVRLRHP